MADSSGTNCTVYVGDIPQVMDEESLLQTFSAYGNIENHMMKATQKQGSSFALITYASHDQAEKAIQELNYSKVEGHPIRVTWGFSQKRPNNEIYNPDANLVISNLPSNVEESSLHELISKFGPIISCRILRNRENVSTGKGYIQFQNVEDAKTALEKLKDAHIGENQIYIEKYLPKNQRQNIPTPLPQNVIAIEGPAESLTEEKLRASFQCYGDIIEIAHIDDFGFIFFAKNESANEAQKKFNQPGLAITKTVRKEITQHVFEKIESRTIFISDLIEPNEASLRAHFGKCGEIVSFDLHSQTIASVQYKTTQERDSAVAQLDHSTFNNHHNPIKVLPFFDSRLEHPECGLLIFNELPITTRYLDFRREFSQYGPILAVSIVPTLTGQCIGYVLFRNNADARKAKEECNHKNIFLFPRGSISDLFQIFGNTKGGRCLSIYDPTMSAVNAYDILYKVSPPIYVDSVGGVVLAYYDDISGALKGLEHMVSLNKEVDISSPYISKWLASLLSVTPIPNDIEQRFVFVKGLKLDINNAQIRELFETNAPVEAAFMTLDPEKGGSKGTASILFTTPEGASSALLSPPFYEQELTVSRYINAKNRTSMPPTQPFQPSARIPPRPREAIRKFIENSKEIQDESVRQQILNKVKTVLSNNDVSELASNQTKLEEWFQAEIKSLQSK